MKPFAATCLLHNATSCTYDMRVQLTRRGEEQLQMAVLRAVKGALKAVFSSFVAQLEEEEVREGGR